MFYKFSQWLDRGIDQNAPASKMCDHPDCQGEGIHRAPKSRHNIQNGHNDWYWFCLEHIRDYNAKWNYYTGMPEKDQLQDRIDDGVWQRPSWPLGSTPRSTVDNQGGDEPFIRVRDPFGFFGEDHPGQTPYHFSARRLSKEQRRALDVFSLPYPFSQEDLLKRYRFLAKQHHPDANNNSLQANESFRKIGDAYRILLRLFETIPKE